MKILIILSISTLLLVANAAPQLNSQNLDQKSSSNEKGTEKRFFKSVSYKGSEEDSDTFILYYNDHYESLESFESSHEKEMETNTKVIESAEVNETITKDQINDVLTILYHPVRKSFKNKNSRLVNPPTPPENQQNPSRNRRHANAHGFSYGYTIHHNIHPNNHIYKPVYLIPYHPQYHYIPYTPSPPYSKIPLHPHFPATHHVDSDECNGSHGKNVPTTTMKPDENALETTQNPINVESTENSTNLPNFLGEDGSTEYPQEVLEVTEKYGRSTEESETTDNILANLFDVE